MGLWELDMTGQLVVRHQWKWIAISHSSGVTSQTVHKTKGELNLSEDLVSE